MGKMTEYITTVKNWGPGAMDAEEAGRARNKISQIQRVVAGNKITKTAVEYTATVGADMVEDLGGRPAKLAMSMASRHKQSKVGIEMPDELIGANANIFKGDTGAFEDIILASDKGRKYVSDGTVDRGQNFSGPMMSLPDAKLFASQHYLRGEVQQVYGETMADAGVLYMNTIIQCLQANDPTGPPPTTDEIYAAFVQSWSNAPTNSLRLPGQRIRVTKTGSGSHTDPRN